MTQEMGDSFTGSNETMVYVGAAYSLAPKSGCIIDTG
jgi:hypothetical protein